jgi:hypothetical protein
LDGNGHFAGLNFLFADQDTIREKAHHFYD